MLELLRSEARLHSLWALLELVAEHEPCTVETVQTLLKRTSPTDWKRLRRLYHLELLERREKPAPARGGGHPIEYRVSRFGREMLELFKALKAQTPAPPLARHAS